MDCRASSSSFEPTSFTSSSSASSCPISSSSSSLSQSRSSILLSTEKILSQRKKETNVCDILNECNALKYNNKNNDSCEDALTFLTSISYTKNFNRRGMVESEENNEINDTEKSDLLSCKHEKVKRPFIHRDLTVCMLSKKVHNFLNEFKKANDTLFADGNQHNFSIEEEIVKEDEEQDEGSDEEDDEEEENKRINIIEEVKNEQIDRSENSEKGETFDCLKKSKKKQKIVLDLNVGVFDVQGIIDEKKLKEKGVQIAEIQSDFQNDEEPLIILNNKNITKKKLIEVLKTNDL